MNKEIKLKVLGQELARLSEYHLFLGGIKMGATDFADENGEFYAELRDWETGRVLDWIKVSGRFC